MPDKRQSLVDQGWDNMRGILDKEMPEKKSNRRFLWIPILAGSFAFVYFLINVRPTSTSDNGDPTFAEEINSTDTKQDVSPAFNKTKNLLIENESKPKLEDNTSDENRSSIKDQKTYESYNIPNEGSIATTYAGKDKSTNESNNESPSNLRPITSNPSIAYYNTELSERTLTGQIAQTPMSTSSSSIQFVNTLMVNSLDIRALTLLPFKDTPPMIKIDVQPDKIRIEPSFYTGLEIGRLISGSAFTYGFHFGIDQPLSDKWAFNSSLGFQKAFGLNNSDLIITNMPPESNSDPLEMDMSTGAPDENNTFIPSEPSLPQNASLKIVEWSSTVKFLFHSNWSAFGGVGLGFNFGDYTEEISSTSSRVTEPELTSFSQFNIGLTAGVSYTLIDHLGIQLRYRHQFMDYIPSDAYQGMDRQLSIGIQWKLQ